jgi:hypothetical protein
MTEVPLTGVIGSVVVIGFTVLGRLFYREARDIASLRERVSRLEARREVKDKKENKEEEK